MPKSEHTNIIPFEEKYVEKVRTKVKDKLASLIENIPELHRVLGCKGCTRVMYKAFYPPSLDPKSDFDNLKGNDILIIYGDNYSLPFTEEEERVCLGKNKEKQNAKV